MQPDLERPTGHLVWSADSFTPFSHLCIILQLAFFEPWSSAVSAGCGVVVALIYWSKYSPLQRFRVPGRRLVAVSFFRVFALLQVCVDELVFDVDNPVAS